MRESCGGSEKITLSTAIDERVDWMSRAVERVCELADADQTYWVLSGCAYPFPANRIEALREVYTRANDVDEVLDAMKEDYFWYEDTRREGDSIVSTKLPGYPDAYAQSTTQQEKRKNYCHVSTVRNHLDRIPKEFCICSSGWYRQLWSGVFGCPVKVDVLQTVAWGGDSCRFSIQIPVAGVD